MSDNQIKDVLKEKYPTCEVVFQSNFVRLYDYGYLVEEFEKNYLIYLIQTEQF